MSSATYSPYRSNLQRNYFQARWFLFGWLFRLHILPQSKILSLYQIPVLKHLPFVTYGEFVLTIPLLILLWKGIECCFIDPSIKISGHIAYYSLVSTFLLANKASSALSFLFGVSWERLVPYHYCASLLAMFFSISHCYVAFTLGTNPNDGDRVLSRGPGGGYGHGGDQRHKSFANPIGIVVDVEDIEASSRFSLLGEEPNLWKYFWDGPVNMAGTVMTISVISLVALSAIRWFRKHFFHVWLVLHILLSLTVVSFSLVHAPSASKVIFVWWVFDAFVRNILQARCFSSKNASLTKLLPDLVEIRFRQSKVLTYRAGQFVRIAVKELNSFEFHPVSISSAPFQDEVTVHFRAVGDWTSRLVELSSTRDEIHVLMQGPFGGLSMNLEDHRRYPRVLLVCGGIGVTPIISLARHLQFTHKMHSQQRVLIHVVWAVQDLAITNVLPILTESARPLVKNGSQSTFDTFPEEPSSSSSMDVEAQTYPVFKGDIYLTRETDSTPEWKDDCYTIHYGCRPDLNTILREYTSIDGNVAVIACGPSALVQAAKVACHKRSSPCVHFDFHGEIFEY